MGHRSCSLAQKRAEIRDWRNKRDLVENVHDMEDRISHDSQKTQKLADGVKRRTQDYNDMLGEVSFLSLSEASFFPHVVSRENLSPFSPLVKYEQLQVQERNLMREMFNIQGQPTSRVSEIGCVPLVVYDVARSSKRIAN